MKNKLKSIIHDMNKVAFADEEKADYLFTNGVVPVVKCKDCKYKGDEDFCPLLSMAQYTEDDDYCSYGGRKEDETNT